MKLVRILFIYTPIALMISIVTLKWCFPERAVIIFFYGAIVSFTVGLLGMVVANVKYKVSHNSLAATMVSLLAMQKYSGFPLIIMAILAFTWFIDFVREIPSAEEISNLSIAGAVFSFAILFHVTAIVIFFEKQKLANIKPFISDLPPQTKGLIITLSTIPDSTKYQQFKKILPKIDYTPQYLRDMLSKLSDLKSENMMSEIDELFDKDRAQFFRFLLQSQLFPALKAILYHYERMEKLWLMVTEKSRDSSLNSFNMLLKQIFEKDDYEIIQIKNPDDINEICRSVDKIYTFAQQKYDLPEEEITADITGGPSSVTAGIILGCVRSKRRVQYLRQNDFKLRAINVTVHNIPRLCDELIEQMELIRAKNNRLFNNRRESQS